MSNSYKHIFGTSAFYKRQRVGNTFIIRENDDESELIYFSQLCGLAMTGGVFLRFNNGSCRNYCH